MCATYFTEICNLNGYLEGTILRALKVLKLATLARDDSIDAAIHSAESLLASLLGRSSLTQTAHAAEDGGPAPLDPEQSILPGQRLGSPPTPDVSLSLHTLGALSLNPPPPLTAQSHAPLLEQVDSPEESLSLLSSRVSVAQLALTPDYDTVYSMLQERERDLDLAAKIGQALLKRCQLLDNDLIVTADLRNKYEQQVSQLRHDIAKKEELLRLYASDAKEREGLVTESEDQEGSNPEWARVLAEECRELRDSNMQLRNEADLLRRETSQVEQQEKELVQQCMQQFSEAKERLFELREESELKSEENLTLQSKLQELSSRHDDVMSHHQQLLEENESLREQIVDAHESRSHLATEVSELQEKYSECSVMLKEAKDEIQVLKDASIHNAMLEGGGQLSTPVEHESIVREIEEVLRQEIIAASTLPERPRSPNHYARQRTMVVMETVRAATLAQARRMERLKAESEQEASRAGTNQGTAFSPITASSPAVERQVFKTTQPAISPPPMPRLPLSPISSEPGSIASMPDDLIRYRTPGYMAPQKLQIVKPMEGSVTLLKWKLLATPQLGGAKSYFSDASRPGVHVKGWKAVGIRDEVARQGLGEVEARQKSQSLMDLPGSLNATYPSLSRRPSRRGRERERGGVRSKAGEQLSVSVGAEGMNDVSGLSVAEREPSLLGRVGNMLGLSRFGFSKKTSDSSRGQSDDGEGVRSEGVQMGDSAGLADVL